MKIGFIFSFIAGILIILANIFALLFTITPTRALFIKFYTGLIVYPTPSLFIIIIGITTGLIIVYGSIQMRKEGNEKKAASLVLLFSIISLFVVGIGSIISVLGAILGIIGGLICYLEIKFIKKLLILVLLLVMIFISGCIFQKKDPRCNWQPESCESLVYPGYYYDSKSNKCIYYEGSGCSDPPFNTISMCLAVCK